MHETCAYSSLLQLAAHRSFKTSNMARMNVALLGLALFATLAVCNAEKKQATEPFCTKASDVKEFTVYPDYEVEVSGVKGTLDFKIAFVDKESKEPISPWHDIPYGLEETDEGAFIWVVNEIPRGDLAKMETMVRSWETTCVQFYTS